jgi:hypothetical protein
VVPEGRLDRPDRLDHQGLPALLGLPDPEDLPVPLGLPDLKDLKGLKDLLARKDLKDLPAYVPVIVSASRKTRHATPVTPPTPISPSQWRQEIFGQ